MQQTVRWIRGDNGAIVDRWTADLAGIPGGCLRLLDQSLLPNEYQFVEYEELTPIIDAIRRLVVRGAPAIGCAAALGLAAIARHYPAMALPEFWARLESDSVLLSAARPTAVNLEWAVRRVMAECRNARPETMAAACDQLLKSALEILAEDIALCRSIGDHGAELLTDGCGILTHCNAGALATGDYGTALAPVYRAVELGRRVSVYSDETRPLLQGSRLTAWELHQAGIDVCTICDNMAAQVMREGRVQIVIVGADRIAANGDTANKIGTYGVAVLAAYHHIPFYVAAPYSTIDRSLPDGAGIPIEERSPDEIGNFWGRRTAPEGVRFYNPAFDVTPHELITGFITERGILAAKDL